MTAAAIADLGPGHHFVYALQLTLGAVFVMSAIPKLRDPKAFSRAVVGYQIIPPATARLVAPLVVAVECLLAVAFLSGSFLQVALPVAGLMLAAFAAAAAINLRRGREVECACFGDPSERVSPQTLARQGLLIAALAALALLFASGTASELTLAELSDEGSSAFAYVVDVGGIAFVVAMFSIWALEARKTGKALRYTFKRPASRAAGKGG